MSVTITRRRVRQLAEQAIARVIEQGNAVDEDPEVIGFRRVSRENHALARGTNVVMDHKNACTVGCPMIAAGFEFDYSDVACSLASEWDRVTREAGLDLGGNTLIYVNQLTD